jgi:transposase
MAISLPDARQLPDDVLAALRLRAVRGIELGFRECDLAELLGVCRATICHWWTAYQQGGLDAVPGDRTGRPQGSGRTLSEEQSAHLQRLIDANTPGQLGIPAPLWTRKAVRDLIRQETGVRMPVRTVGAYLKRWGYTAKRPRRRAKKQDPEEVRQWLEETYPALERRASAEDAEIFWCDEAGVAADETHRLGYAREGQPAVVEVPAPHIRVNLISAISHHGAVRFMTYKQNLDGALFLTFLGRLLRTTRRKVFLIVGRLRNNPERKRLKTRPRKRKRPI